jgi:Zn-dependent peptidase ImmA (M78 family)/transcriptional regulator with XRE-family HTH domain
MSGISQRLVPALFDGDRLRQARLYRGWRKVEVANAIDISPAAVGQYESGKSRPSAQVLASLTLHLGFPPAFFERRGGGQPAPRIAGDQAHFRKLRSTTKLERDRLLVRLELLAEVLADIETYVQLPDIDLPVHVVGEDAPDGEPERVAAEVRDAWGLGRGPIDNVVRLLEAKGVVVVRPHVGSEGVDAFSTWLDKRPVVVLGSDKNDAARARFDAPHELGHLVMHHDAEPGRHIVEKQAHRFAAAFMMPADVITDEFPARMSWPAYFKLKERWRVSLQALLYRARTLGALSPDGYRRAQVHISRQGWRNAEPISIGAPERPALMQRALELMKSELSIDESAVADTARLPEPVFYSLLHDVGAAEPDLPKVVLT